MGAIVALLDPVTQVASVRALSTVASSITLNQERVSWESSIDG
jgi:hypothetical protein